VLNTPIGPGFFIFFQDVRIEKEIQEAGAGRSKYSIDSDRIMKDDNEILEILTSLANCNVLY
jgi:hypothetical protein